MCLLANRDVHEAFLVETEARLETLKPETEAETEASTMQAKARPRPRPSELETETRPRRTNSEARPRKGTILRHEMASRPRHQDRGHIPHPHHSKD